MVGMKLLVKRGKSKDILQITRVLYTEEKDVYKLECKSLCNSTIVNTIMSVNDVKNSLIR